MLIGDVTFREAVELLHPAQASLGREINAQVFAEDEFRKKTRTPFLRDVLAKPKLFLVGGDDDLEELAGH